jgi:hypothetical protein
LTICPKEKDILGAWREEIGNFVFKYEMENLSIYDKWTLACIFLLYGNIL